MSDRPPGGQDWPFHASHSSSHHFADLSARLGYLDHDPSSSNEASLFRTMKKRPGRGSLNAYIRVDGGEYLILCDMLRSGDKVTKEGETTTYMLDERTSKCLIISERIAVTIAGDSNRQQELWTALLLKEVALEVDEVPDVHDVKGWADQYLMDNQVLFDDGVEGFIIGFSRKEQACIALLFRDTPDGGPDLHVDYPIHRSYDALGSGDQSAENKWGELGIDNFIDEDTLEMGRGDALYFLKQGFLAASINDIEVGGSYEVIHVRNDGAEMEDLGRRCHFIDVAFEFDHPLNEDTQLLFFDNLPYDNMFEAKMKSTIWKEVSVRAISVVPFGCIRNR